MSLIPPPDVIPLEWSADFWCEYRLKMKRPKAVKMFREELDRMYAAALEEEKLKSKPRL